MSAARLAATVTAIEARVDLLEAGIAAEQYDRTVAAWLLERLTGGPDTARLPRQRTTSRDDGRHDRRPTAYAS